jgi:hypothetical protein
MTLYSRLAEAIEHGAAELITGWAQGVLDDVATGRNSISAVSHPLGFLCLPVHRLREEGVCIHVWGSRWHRPSLTTSPAHCHSWELRSWVLAGELHNQVVRVIDGTESPTHRVFEVHSSAAGDQIRPTRRLVRHEVANTVAYRAGDRYRLSAGVFHQTVVPDTEGLVATVALGMTRAGAVDLSLGGLRTTSHEMRRELCDVRGTREVAALARQAVAAQVRG